MPTREEIAEQLKRTAKLLPPYFKPSFLTTATQVAAMRCKTCKWYESETDDDHDWCHYLDCNAWGVDFGCFRHEQKE